jgi:hypothetical protein
MKDLFMAGHCPAGFRPSRDAFAFPIDLMERIS